MRRVKPSGDFAQREKETEKSFIGETPDFRTDKGNGFLLRRTLIYGCVGEKMPKKRKKLGLWAPPLSLLLLLLAFIIAMIDAKTTGIKRSHDRRMNGVGNKMDVDGKRLNS